LDHTRDNLLRLMAAHGLSIQSVAERTRLDARTIRGILNEQKKPHIRTLHRLADGLGVNVDEFFVDPAALLYRRFDPNVRPLVSKLIQTHRALFHGWTEADFDALHRHVDASKSQTVRYTLRTIHRMNQTRDLHRKFDRLLESDHAEIAAGLVTMLYEKTIATNVRHEVPPTGREPG
jgi:transcriptional regulator with XRE-family HTH domain